MELIIESILSILYNTLGLNRFGLNTSFFRFFKNVATAAPAHEFAESEVLHDFSDNVPPLKSM